MSCDVDGADEGVKYGVVTTGDDKEDASRFREEDGDKPSQYVKNTSCVGSNIRETPIKG